MEAAILKPQFQDPEKAREFLEAKRWPDGPICPHCGIIGEAVHLDAQEGTKTHARRGLLNCRACRKQFSVTVGTIFEDSHIPLNKWLLAFHLLCASKKGMSAHQLHRMLGVTYKSAWFMAHRIRYAMSQEPLASMHMERVTAENLRPVIDQMVDESAHLMTDTASVLKFAGTVRKHSKVNHAASEYVRKEDGVTITTNAVEGYFANLRRGIDGVYHHVGKHHLHRYLSEFDFRYNSRDVTDAERAQLALKQVDGKRLMLRDSREKSA